MIEKERVKLEKLKEALSNEGLRLFMTGTGFTIRQIEFSTLPDGEDYAFKDPVIIDMFFNIKNEFMAWNKKAIADTIGTALFANRGCRLNTDLFEALDKLPDTNGYVTQAALRPY